MAAGKKNQKINVPTLLVDKDVISYGNSFICTKNISLITISAIPSNKTWIIAIIVGLLGFYMQNEMESGMFLIIASIIWIIGVVVYNVNRGDNLAVSLNSGTTLYFHCKNRIFLKAVLQKLIASIKENNCSTYTISFDRCTIHDGALNSATIR